MNASFATPAWPAWCVLLFGILVILAALFAFKVMSVAFNAMLGRQVPMEPHQGRRRRNLILGGLLPLFVVMFCLMAFVRIGDRRSVPVVGAIAVEKNRSLTEAMSDLADARRDIHQALGEVSQFIPIDVAVPSLSPKHIADDSATTTSAVVSDGTASADEQIQPAASTTEIAAVAEGNSPASTPAKESQESPVAAETSAAPESIAPETVASESVASKPDETVSSANEPAISGSQDESPADRQKRLSELASHIGPWIQSLMDEETQAEVSIADAAAQAAESADKKIVVFQLPGQIRQTYALIPLTPALDAAVSPMKPLLTNRGLESIANSIAAILKNFEGANADAPGIAEATLNSAAAVESTDLGGTVVLSTEPKDEKIPDWIQQPDGGRVVVKTEALLPDDETRKPLVAAINSALSSHMKAFTEPLDPVLHKQASFVKMELDESTALQCVVTEFGRNVMIDTMPEGQKMMRIVYALVEFPEAVDNQVVQEIRRSVQRDRIVGLGLIVGSFWMSVCSIGCGVRLWNNGSYLRKTLSIPMFAVLALPLLLLAAGIVVLLAKGDAPRYPWADAQKPISIHVEKST